MPSAAETDNTSVAEGGLRTGRTSKGGISRGQPFAVRAGLVELAVRHLTALAAVLGAGGYRGDDPQRPGGKVSGVIVWGWQGAGALAFGPRVQR